MGNGFPYTIITDTTENNMIITKVFTVVSCHRHDDGDHDVVEFVTDNEEYAKQWVYAARRSANDPFAYDYDSTELRSV